MNYEMLRDIVNARRNLFTFVAFLLLLNLALALYLSLWQRPELAQAQTDWFAKRKALASGQSVGTVTKYQEGVRGLERFQERLIPKKEFAAFLSQMFQSAKNNSLTMKGISYKPGPTKEKGVVSYALSYTVAGKYASVKSYIADLSRFPEMITLDAVALNNASRTEETVDLKIQMTAYLKMEGA